MNIEQKFHPNKSRNKDIKQLYKTSSKEMLGYIDIKAYIRPRPTEKYVIAKRIENFATAQYTMKKSYKCLEEYILQFSYLSAQNQIQLLKNTVS